MAEKQCSLQFGCAVNNPEDCPGPCPPTWLEVPVVIDGIPGYCSLNVPYSADREAVKLAVAALPGKKARFHQ